MRKKLKLLLSVFWVFFRIGAFTFGGGYAMIPLITEETVNKRKWISDKDILDIFAIAESTPGPIAINSATFVGYRVAGFWGSFFATLGVVSPSLLIISLLARLLEFLAGNEIAASAFAGISVAVCAIIVKALTGLTKSGITDIFTAIIAVLAFVCMLVLHLSPIVIIISAAVLGVLYKNLIYGKVFKSKEEKK